jgi:anaerobic magnesium-protoporphyrin IX monomethyl ester cyclase
MDRDADFEIGVPVHLALLGEAARSQGWAVEYLDMTLEEKDGCDSFGELAARLLDPVVAMVGVSNHTVRTSVTTRIVAERIHQIRPDVQVVVGGVNATFMWRELLEDCHAIDYVLRGYAQHGLRALLAGACIGPECVPGLATRCAGQATAQPLAPIVARDFATPSLDGLPISRYLAWTRTYPLLTHTGCGFSCNFCTSVMPAPNRNHEVCRPVEDVLREMTLAVDYGFTRFFMSANTFTARREYCMKLCEAIRTADLVDRMSWVCMTRVECVDDELLCAMRLAGCKSIGYGVETAGDKTWEDIAKGRFSRETICRAFAQTRDACVDTTAYVILGVPNQTRENIEDTLGLLRELDPVHRVVSFFQPFPGTPYWNDPEGFGISELEPLEEWNFHEAPVCRTAYFDKSQLMRAAIRAHLERGHRGVLDPSRDSLEMVADWHQQFPDAPVAARVAFEQLDGCTPIEQQLDSIVETYGCRGRLIALYWLAACARKGVVRIVSRQTRAADVRPILVYSE